MINQLKLRRKKKILDLIDQILAKEELDEVKDDNLVNTDTLETFVTENKQSTITTTKSSVIVKKKKKLDFFED